MTPRVPHRVCKKCDHYRDGQCPLINLDACVYSETQERPRVGLFLVIIGIISAVFILFGCSKQVEGPSPEQAGTKSAVELLRNQHKGELSDFDKLVLAIALTESRFNPNADSGHGDYGLLQLREIYLEEVNRLYGTDYTIKDAYDIDKSLEMFRLMQEAYNPNKDIEKAVFHHNKSVAYKMKALENYELICRMEEVRKKLTSK